MCKVHNFLVFLLMRYFDCLVVFIYVLHLKYMLESRINTLVDCLELSIDVVVTGRGMLLIYIEEKKSEYKTTRMYYYRFQL